MITTSYFYQNARDGFNHIGLLMDDGQVILTVKIHYINHTWESYNGQTARKAVCRKYMQAADRRAIESAKKALGYSRATAKVKAEAARYLEIWPTYQEVKKELATL